MAHDWDALGFSDDQRTAWVAAGFDLAAANEWRSHGFGSDASLARGYMIRGLSAAAAARLRLYDLAPEHLDQFVKVGVNKVDDIIDWSEEVGDPSEVAMWRDLGVEKPSMLPGVDYGTTAMLCEEYGLNAAELPASEHCEGDPKDWGTWAMRLVRGGFPPHLLASWLPYVRDEVPVEASVEWAAALGDGCVHGREYDPYDFGLDFNLPGEHECSDGTFAPLLAVVAHRSGFTVSDYRHWFPMDPRTAAELRQTGVGAREAVDLDGLTDERCSYPVLAELYSPFALAEAANVLRVMRSYPSDLRRAIDMFDAAWTEAHDDLLDPFYVDRGQVFYPDVEVKDLIDKGRQTRSSGELLLWFTLTGDLAICAFFLLQHEVPLSALLTDPRQIVDPLVHPADRAH